MGYADVGESGLSVKQLQLLSRFESDYPNEMVGRGAWNTAGLGGTKKYLSDEPGPYYYIGTGRNANLEDPNEFAVWSAVKAYQKVINRRLDIRINVDGTYGKKMANAIKRFQEKTNNTVWGGIGPDTSRSLLMPDLVQVWKRRAEDYVPVNVISGTIDQESLWDAGAVGYLDPSDVGLAQINAQAHPTWTTEKRLQPVTSFKFVVDMYNSSIPYFDGNLRDAIASYNLGKGGATSWIKDGRPDIWTPPGSSRPRNVKQYIDNILEG